MWRGCDALNERRLSLLKMWGCLIHGISPILPDGPIVSLTIAESPRRSMTPVLPIDAWSAWSIHTAMLCWRKARWFLFDERRVRPDHPDEKENQHDA